MSRCEQSGYPSVQGGSPEYVATLRSGGGGYTITDDRPGIQVWIVPVSGRYTIEATGAAGGYARVHDTATMSQYGGSTIANGGRE